MNKGMVTTLFLVLMTMIQTEPKAEITRFTHFLIAELPGTEWGTAGPAVGDFDNDGDLDVAIARRELATLFWYENSGHPERWIQHVAYQPQDQVMKEIIAPSLPAAAIDADRDGFVDIVMSRLWLRNPGNLGQDPDASWQAHLYPGNGHDVWTVDINLDGKQDIVTSNNESAYWYETGATFQSYPIAEGLKLHGATAPNGAGDLDGDGDLDLIVLGNWFENPGTGKGTWIQHSWPYQPIPKASYGPSIRVWVTDLDEDGRNDFVYSDCDTGWGHVYWVQNQGRDRWVRHQLEDPPGHPETGSFHSLAVADFDLDGDIDIFAGEQEDPDTYMRENGLLPMKPEGLQERGVIWENLGPGEAPSFVPRLINEGRPGWHDVVMADMDGDGDMDLVSKVWNTGGKPYHADFWRNDNQ
jgi:hypothetical protein